MEKTKVSSDVLTEKSTKDDDDLEKETDDHSGLVAGSDNVEDAILEECENFGNDSENEKSIEERLRSASLTGSIHEMTDDVRRLSLEQSNFEEELEQGCCESLD